MKKEAGSLVTRFLLWLITGCISSIFLMFLVLSLYNWSYNHVIPFQKAVNKTQPMISTQSQREAIIQDYLNLYNGK
jgi:hypothetical protein